MVRSYGQYCAVAKSLDVIGDRWTLLIVRELLDGPLRYGDLLAALTPIATDMLAARLRDLESHGVLERRELPRPASGRVYQLTERGRALEDVINAYARWGRHLIETRAVDEVMQPQWLARAVRAFARPDRPEMDLVLRLAIPEGSRTLRITAAAIEDVDDETVQPDVVLSGDAETLFAAMDPDSVQQLLRAGTLRAEGEPAALRSLSRVFGPAREATATRSQ